MARKRKKKEMPQFEPSHYQKSIYDFVEHGNGNLIVEASAGSGKTSTLLKIIDLLPSDKKILFCAFNKDIVKEITKRIDKEKTNVDIRTVHSLGYLMTQRNINERKLSINENKYREFIFNKVDELTTINLKDLGFRNKMKYIDNVCKLVDYARYNLAITEKDMLSLVEKYEVEIFDDESIVALKVLDWGKSFLEEVDYTDMVWLPSILFMKPLGTQYDYILVDECQDLSTAQRELILKCRKINTRMFMFGDKDQTIYTFMSSDFYSFEKLKNLPNTVCMPLSISYRCPKNIVDFAKKIVPTIEHNENNPIEGLVIDNVDIEDVKDGDMVLCRNNAPLMKIYNDFIRVGKKCKIRGKDIGLNLKRVVKSTHKDELNVSLDKDGVFVRLYDSLFELRDSILMKSSIDYETVMSSSIIVNNLDMIKALEVLSEGINTSEELIEKITNMFSDKKNDGIVLSTIHKAKGLEAENVYIACKSLMPCKSATKDWEKEQEKNLMYVAYTRAKSKLGFLVEDGFEYLTKNKNEKLAEIEFKVNKVLNKKPKNIINNKHYINEIINNAKKIELPKIGNSKNISDTTSNVNLMSGVLNKRRKIKIKN